MGGEGKSRGELAEIRTQLDSLSRFGGSRPDTVTAKKDLFKKIINYATIGIDMSSVFMQVIKCAASSSDDVVLKKMLYLFICTYAQSNPDLTLLTVNLLTKDCQDQDPTIRGLALRSLCSLRVGNLLEYLTTPVQMGLQDRHPYVRRTAVMGVLKIFNLEPTVVKDQGLIDVVRGMALNESDAQVVSNCLSVLKQVGETQRLVQRTYVVSLINRLKDFSEWGQCQVLEIVSHYRPSNEEELYDIMNIMDDRLSHSNTAVVMATVKVFLHLTLNLPATHQQVLERIVSPLQTLVSRDHYETAYAVLCNVRTLAQRAPFIFAQIYPTLYCRVHEPSYIKRLKLEILSIIADESNAYDIVSELTEYVNDIDVQLSREAVNAVGQIALKVPDVGGIVERLLGFLEIGKEHITAETIIQMKDLLRRYPDIAEICISSIGSINPLQIEEVDARAAFVWILGQYGHAIQDAPYVLEPLAANFSNEEVAVRNALLTAAAKLFFQRPPECHMLLGQLLAAGSLDSNQDVHDRALMYYRLFQYDVNSSKEVISTALPPTTQFSEEQSAEVRDKIFEEFNSLSAVYNAPSTSFMDQEALVYEETEDVLPLANGSGYHVDEGSSLLPDAGSGSDHGTPRQEGIIGVDSSINPAPVSASQPAIDLLGMDDLLGGMLVTAAPSCSPPPPPTLQLRPQPVMSPTDFQKRWTSLQHVKQLSHSLTPTAVTAIEANKHQDFVKHVAQSGLATMASGGSSPVYRFYFHAQKSDADTRFLTEVIVNKTTSTANITVKADDADYVDQFASLFTSIVGAFAA